MRDEDKRMVAWKLDQMFQKEKHFSICTVDDCCKLLRCRGSGPAYDRLRMLHCVNWGDIPADIMERIPSWLNEVFGGPPLSSLMIPALREGSDFTCIEDAPALPRGVLALTRKSA